MGGSATMRAGTRVNAEQASRRALRKPTLLRIGEGRRLAGKRATRAPAGFRRGSGAGTHGKMESAATREALPVPGTRQPEPREGRAGPGRVADGPVVPGTRGNARRGKGP